MSNKSFNKGREQRKAKVAAVLKRELLPIGTPELTPPPSLSLTSKKP